MYHFIITKIMLMIITSILFSSMGNKENQPKKEDAQASVNLDSVQLFMEYDKTEAIQVSENVTRKFAYLNDLMIVIVDFENGPMAEPDPFHSHVHEQTSYVAEGEVLVIIGDKKKHLKAGDIFIVPSGVPHTVQSLTPKLRLIDSFNPIREDFIQK